MSVCVCVCVLDRLDKVASRRERRDRSREEGVYTCVYTRTSRERKRESFLLSLSPSSSSPPAASLLSSERALFFRFSSLIFATSALPRNSLFGLLIYDITLHATALYIIYKYTQNTLAARGVRKRKAKLETREKHRRAYI